MPPRIMKGYGEYLTVHWKKSQEFPHGSISVTSGKNLCDGTLKYQNLLNTEVLMKVEGKQLMCKVVFQGSYKECKQAMDEDDTVETSLEALKPNGKQKKPSVKELERQDNMDNMVEVLQKLKQKQAPSKINSTASVDVLDVLAKSKERLPSNCQTPPSGAKLSTFAASATPATSGETFPKPGTGTSKGQSEYSGKKKPKLGKRALTFDDPSSEECSTNIEETLTNIRTASLNPKKCRKGSNIDGQYDDNTDEQKDKEQVELEVEDQEELPDLDALTPRPRCRKYKNKEIPKFQEVLTDQLDLQPNTTYVYIDENPHDEQIEELKRENQSLKDKILSLKAHKDEDMVELFPNSDVFINSEMLGSLIFNSTGGTSLARGLFKHLFTVEELQTHSLNGRKCPALGEDQVIRPPLDANRKNAIFNFVFQHFGFAKTNGYKKTMSNMTHVNERNFKTSLMRSISDLLREQRKK